MIYQITSKNVMENVNMNNELDDVVSDIKRSVLNATNVVKKKSQQNEAVGATLLAAVLSGPFLLKILGNALNKAKKLITGNDSITADKMVNFANELHHKLEAPFKLLAKTVTQDTKKQKIFAESLLGGIIAILFALSGFSAVAFAAKLKVKTATLYSAKTAIKGKELKGMIKDLGNFIKQEM